MDSYMDPESAKPCAQPLLRTYLSSGYPSRSSTNISFQWLSLKKASEFSYWKSWPSLGVGVGCRATTAAFPSTFMESTTVGRPKAASIMVPFMVPHIVAFMVPFIVPYMGCIFSTSHSDNIAHLGGSNVLCIPRWLYYLTLTRVILMKRIDHTQTTLKDWTTMIKHRFDQRVA